jgi:hypothetical protein
MECIQHESMIGFYTRIQCRLRNFSLVIDTIRLEPMTWNVLRKTSVQTFASQYQEVRVALLVNILFFALETRESNSLGL